LGEAGHQGRGERPSRTPSWRQDSSAAELNFIEASSERGTGIAGVAMVETQLDDPDVVPFAGGRRATGLLRDGDQDMINGKPLAFLKHRTA